MSFMINITKSKNKNVYIYVTAFRFEVKVQLIVLIKGIIIYSLCGYKLELKLNSTN